MQSGRTPGQEGVARLSIGEIATLARDSGAVDLALGSPDSESQSAWSAAAIAAINSGVHHYSPTAGVEDLRNAVSAYYRSIDAGSPLGQVEDVCVTVGATEAIAATLMSLHGRGDEVVIFEPCYEGYRNAIEMAGAIPRVVKLRQHDWRIEERSLRLVLSSKTRAILFNSPHNPTGRIFDAEEIDLIARLVDRTQAVVISDEVYSEFYYTDTRPPSPALVESLHSRTIRIGSASKMMGVTGWRVGWLAGPEHLVKAAAQVHVGLTACAPVPFQLAVAGTLADMGNAMDELRGIYKTREDVTRRAFLDAGFEVPQPDGGFYLLARYPGVNDSYLLYQTLLENAKIATVPLSLFFAGDGARHAPVRVAFCKPWPVLETAVSRLRLYTEAISAHQRRGRTRLR